MIFQFAMLVYQAGSMALTKHNEHDVCGEAASPVLEDPFAILIVGFGQKCLAAIATSETGSEAILMRIQVAKKYG